MVCLLFCIIKHFSYHGFWDYTKGIGIGCLSVWFHWGFLDVKYDHEKNRLKVVLVIAVISFLVFVVCLF